MKKNTKLLIAVLLAVLILGAAAFGIFGYWLPYHNAASSVPADAELTLYQQADGKVQITWPRAADTDHYLLEILIPGQEAPEAEYSCYVSGENSHIVDRLPEDSPRTIRIRTYKEYTYPFESSPRLRLSEDAIEVTDRFDSPQIREVSWKPDPDKDHVEVKLSLPDDCTARLYEVSEEDPVPAETIAGGKTTLYFGDGQPWPMPSFDDKYAFAFDAYRQAEGYVYYSIMTEPITLVREDLLGTNLELTCAEKDYNIYTFSWNETKGDYYAFQHRKSDSEEWETLLEVPADGIRSYTTVSLEPYTYQEYRVIACREQAASEEAPVAESETAPVQTASSVLYTTIWPIQDLEVYADTQKSQTLGTAECGTAFCVLALEEGLFQIRYGSSYGYIDSNYCMINLPEFIGSLCLYDITNSYSSLYKIHEFDIPEVTETVIGGYERIQLSKDNYLVPLLYPTAQKLEQAALDAAEEGYTLKIYDSFRPQMATLSLYEQAVEFTKEAIPEEDLPEELRPETPPETEGTEEDTEEAEPYTYGMYMTDNGRYALNYFLAKGRSRHNQGLAMDLTLVSAYGELEMQTAMHDLSWYSETGQNNSNAYTLARIMKGAGFAGLVSEWWHFQDDEAKSALEPAALWNGVTPECWMADENGWRYRRADGSYYKSCTRTIDGITYEFDANGYVIDL